MGGNVNGNGHESELEMFADHSCYTLNIVLRCNWGVISNLFSRHKLRFGARSETARDWKDQNSVCMITVWLGWSVFSPDDKYSVRMTSIQFACSEFSLDDQYSVCIISFQFKATSWCILAGFGLAVCWSSLPHAVGKWTLRLNLSNHSCQ